MGRIAKVAHPEGIHTLSGLQLVFSFAIGYRIGEYFGGRGIARKVDRGIVERPGITTLDSTSDPPFITTPLGKEGERGECADKQNGKKKSTHE